MKKFLIKTIIVLTAYCLLATGSQAEMTSGSNRISIPTVSGGGEDEMTSGDYRMQDLKGQGVVGGMTGGGYGIGLGGLYGTLVTGEVVVVVPPLEIEDSGRIRQTWIERVGDDVVLHWDYDSGGPIAVVIFVDRAENYSTDGGDYRDMSVPHGSLESSHTFVGLVRDGENYYFRVVPWPLVDPDIMAAANNSITVAKLDYTLVRPYNLIGVPLVTTADTGDPANPHDQRLDAVIGDQMRNGNQIYMYNMIDLLNRRYDIAQYGARTWGDPFRILPGVGYWVYRDPEEADAERVITIVGRVLNTDYGGRLENLYTLIANPYPVRRTPATVGLAPESGDQIYSFLELEAPQRYNVSQYDGGTRTWDPATDVLSGRGYWYFKDGAGIAWPPPRP